jgi:hypothetical protein
VKYEWIDINQGIQGDFTRIVVCFKTDGVVTHVEITTLEELKKYQKLQRKLWKKHHPYEHLPLETEPEPEPVKKTTRIITASPENTEDVYIDGVRLAPGESIDFIRLYRKDGE